MASRATERGVDLLVGVRVVDFTHVHAGPLCAYHLGLMGADIIKVESPDGGDQMRDADPDGMPPAFLGQNANKRSLVLDLKQTDGLVVVRRLVETADVVLHNMRPGTPDRLGIGYSQVTEWRPDVVYCAISGYGQDGPESDRAAYDHLIQGESGMFMATGTEDMPVRVGFAVADAGSAMIASSAILAALLRRQRTGAGAFLDVSMLESSMALMGLNYYNFLATGRPMPRVGPNPLAQAGSAGTFQTTDGTLLVNAHTYRHFKMMATALGREDLPADPRYATPAAAAANRVELRRTFAAHFATGSASHWMTILRRAGIPCGRLKGPREALESPQLAHRRAVKTLDGVAGGELRFLGTGFTVDGEPATPSRPPPRLGEHSAELLAELGYDVRAVADMRARGVTR